MTIHDYSSTAMFPHITSVFLNNIKGSNKTFYKINRYLITCKMSYNMIVLNLEAIWDRLRFVRSQQSCRGTSLQWRHNDRDGISNDQPHDCLLSRLFRRSSKKNIKAPRHWPLCGEFTDDRWIPRTKGQWRGKWLHLMTSSYVKLQSDAILVTVRKTRG